MPRKTLSSDEKMVSVNLKIPESLRDRIENVAIKDDRFLSQEIRILILMGLEIREQEQAQAKR